jgi:hypothetical protein
VARVGIDWIRDRVVRMGKGGKSGGIGENKGTVEGLTRDKEVVGSRILIERYRGGRSSASIAISVLASTWDVTGRPEAAL